MPAKEDRVIFSKFRPSKREPDFSHIHLEAALERALGEAFDGKVSSAAIAEALIPLATELRSVSSNRRLNSTQRTQALLVCAIIACLQGKSADGWSFKLKGVQGGKSKQSRAKEKRDLDVGQFAQERVEAGDGYHSAIKAAAKHFDLGLTATAAALAKFRADEKAFDEAIAKIISERYSG